MLKPNFVPNLILTKVNKPLDFLHIIYIYIYILIIIIIKLILIKLNLERLNLKFIESIANTPILSNILVGTKQYNLRR